VKDLLKTKGIKPLTRRQIAARAAQDVVEGYYVNLGIGMPTLIADYVTPGKEVIYHSENGMLGMGPAPALGEEDEDNVNAGKQYVTLVDGGSYFNSVDSFVIMRGGHLDMVFLGAFQVSEDGDLANWMTEDRTALPSVGGAMDLAVGCKNICVLMEHVTKDGNPRILKKCSYALTAKRVVKRIYSDLAIIDILNSEMVVREMIEGVSFELLQKLTEATLSLDSQWRTLQRHCEN
jgi:3-oxoadipate CoA-transferase beta subunit